MATCEGIPLEPYMGASAALFASLHNSQVDHDIPGFEYDSPFDLLFSPPWPTLSGPERSTSFVSSSLLAGVP